MVTRGLEEGNAPGSPEVREAVEHAHVAGHAAERGAQPHRQHQRAGLAGAPVAARRRLARLRRRLHFPRIKFHSSSCDCFHAALLHACNCLFGVLMLDRAHGTQLAVVEVARASW